MPIELLIAQSRLPVLLDFTKNNHTPSRLMTPIIQRVMELTEGFAHIVRIDIEKNAELVERFRVNQIPSLLLLVKGEVVWREVGVVPSNYLVGIIRKYKETS